MNKLLQASFSRCTAAKQLRYYAVGSVGNSPPGSTVETPVHRVEKTLNQVTLLGRVGVDPQLRGTDEHPVTVFTLATHTNYRYQSGEMQQKTEWHRVSVFRPHLRDTVFKFLTKGQRVLVQGKIMYGQITDSGGVVHTTSTIVADDLVFFNRAERDAESSEHRE